MSSETAGRRDGRVEVIDAIRGFALLGIVVANIQSWSGYRFLPYTEIAQLPAASWDAALWSLQKFFIEAKFYALFSMLFGVGFWLQYDHNREREAEFVPIYRRRLGFLLLFGVLHALVWSGDILTLYALVGFVFVLFRNLKPSGVLASSLACFTIFIVPNTIMMFVSPGEPHVPDLARKVYPDMNPKAVVSALSCIRNFGPDRELVSGHCKPCRRNGRGKWFGVVRCSDAQRSQGRVGQVREIKW